MKKLITSNDKFNKRDLVKLFETVNETAENKLDIAFEPSSFDDPLALIQNKQGDLLAIGSYPEVAFFLKGVASQ